MKAKVSECSNKINGWFFRASEGTVKGGGRFRIMRTSKQRKIGRILAEYDDKIMLNKKINDNLAA